MVSPAARIVCDGDHYYFAQVCRPPRKGAAEYERRLCRSLLDEAVCAEFIAEVLRVNRRRVDLHVRAHVRSPVLRQPDHYVASWLQRVAAGHICIALQLERRASLLDREHHHAAIYCQALDGNDLV